jgi:hypothetical protein
MKLTSVKPLIGIVAVALLLSGCAASQPGRSSASPSSSSTANTVAALVTLGDGSCEKFLPAATVARDLGSTLALNPDFSGQSGQEVAIGGLGCHWYFGEQGDPASAEANISIVPASIAPSSVVSASTSSSPCATNTDLGTQNSGCSVAGVLNGWWYEAKLFTFVSPTAQSANAQLFQSTINAALKSVHAPGAIETKTALTCQAVDASIKSGANLGHGTLSVQTTHPDNDSAGVNSPLDFAITSIGETSCTWTGTDFSFSLTIDPGSPSVFRTCGSRVGAQSGTISGVKSLVIFPPDEGSLVLCASDGASTVELNAGGFSTNDASGWDQANLSLAQKIVVPVLASARQ